MNPFIHQLWVKSYLYGSPTMMGLVLNNPRRLIWHFFQFVCPDLLIISNNAQFVTEGPCGVVANVLDRDTVASEFEFLLRSYVHFTTNTLGKGMNLLSPQVWVK